MTKKMVGVDLQIRGTKPHARAYKFCWFGVEGNLLKIAL